MEHWRRNRVYMILMVIWGRCTLNQQIASCVMLILIISNYTKLMYEVILKLIQSWNGSAVLKKGAIPVNITTDSSLIFVASTVCDTVCGPYQWLIARAHWSTYCFQVGIIRSNATKWWMANRVLIGVRYVNQFHFENVFALRSPLRILKVDLFRVCCWDMLLKHINGICYGNRYGKTWCTI